jgi:AcrR family transcriptional regulator
MSPTPDTREENLMPKLTSPKQQLITKFRQSEILAAARRIFARDGFDAALVDDIAAEAGIAKGTVYLYFKSKNDIYTAALREDLEALGEIKRQRLAAANGLHDKLLAFVTAILEYCDERRDFFRIYLIESGKPACGQLHHKEISAHKTAQARMLADLFAESARSGEIRSIPPERAAILVADAIRGTVERRLLESHNPPAAADARTLVDLLWNGFTPPRAPARTPPGKSRPRAFDK